MSAGDNSLCGQCSQSRSEFGGWASWFERPRRRLKSEEDGPIEIMVIAPVSLKYVISNSCRSWSTWTGKVREVANQGIQESRKRPAVWEQGEEVTKERQRVLSLR